MTATARLNQNRFYLGLFSVPFGKAVCPVGTERNVASAPIPCSMGFRQTNSMGHVCRLGLGCLPLLLSLGVCAQFVMPPEEAPHEGTWLQWPHNYTYGAGAEWVEPSWVAMTQALTEGERVHILAYDAESVPSIVQQLQSSSICHRPALSTVKQFQSSSIIDRPALSIIHRPASPIVQPNQSSSDFHRRALSIVQHFPSSSIIYRATISIVQHFPSSSQFHRRASSIGQH